MKCRIARWWHRYVVGHALGPQVYLCTIPSPWPDLPEFAVCDVWATICQVDGCYWSNVEVTAADRDAELA